MDNKALYKLSYGLYVVGVKQKDGRLGGCIVDAVVQASSSSPAVLIVCSMIGNHTNATIKETGEFTLSVLPKTIDPFVIANFGFQSSTDADKWANVPYELKDQLPVLLNGVSYLRCKVTQSQELPTHTAFFCEVVDGWLGSGEPLIYGDYQAHMKTAAVEAFDAFKNNGVPVEKPAASSNGWVCSICGYAYDGDTPFEELPENWLCPLCKQPKTVYEKK